MRASGKSKALPRHFLTEDPSVFAADLHRMSWSEYLELAEIWKAQKRNQIAVRRRVLICALVLAPLLAIGLRLHGGKLNSGPVSVTGSLPTPSSQATQAQGSIGERFVPKGQN